MTTSSETPSDAPSDKPTATPDEISASPGAASSQPRALVPAPAATLLAFAVHGIVTAGFIAALQRAKAVVRFWHQVVDAGHFLFLGAVAGLLVLAWIRLVPKWAARGFVALGVIGVAIAYVLAREDFAGFASDAGGERGGPFILGGLLLVAGLSPALAVLVGSRIARRHTALAIALAFVGLLMAVANGLILPADYPGVHLFIALDSAALLAVGIAHLPLPSRAQRPVGPRFAPIALAVLALISLPAVIIRPNNAVRTQLTRVETAFLVPVLATYLWDMGATATTPPPGLGPWFVDRRQEKAISPSKGPSLLPTDPIVLLVGIDSLRADLFETKDGRERLPNLLALRERAVSFSVARSPGSRTITTWSSIFSGRYVTGLKWNGNGNRLSIADDRTKRFSDYLHDGGVHTTSFVSYSALGKPGLSRLFDEVVHIKPRDGQPFGLSEDVMPEIIERITEPHDNGAFHFAHMMDAHSPYDAAGATKGSNRSRFLSEVELVDKSIGVLWKALEDKGLLDRTVLIVTADHGEGLGEHDTLRHTVNLYEELIRVPLMMVIPGVKPRKVDTPVSLMDLGPTILDLFSKPTPASFLGESLLPFARGETPELTRPIGAERSGTRALLFGSKKVILDKSKGRQEIYDLSTDPEEAKNLVDDMGAEGARLVGQAQAFFDVHATPK